MRKLLIGQKRRLPIGLDLVHPRPDRDFVVTLQECDRRLEHRALVHLAAIGRHHRAELVDQQVELVTAFLLTEVPGLPRVEWNNCDELLVRVRIVYNKPFGIIFVIRIILHLCDRYKIYFNNFDLWIVTNFTKARCFQSLSFKLLTYTLIDITFSFLLRSA